MPSVYVGLEVRQYRITKAEDYSYMDSRLIRLVEKWACNVTGTVSEEKNRISDNFLGVTYFMSVHTGRIIMQMMEGCRHTGCIRNLHAQNEHKCGIVRPSQIVADEPTNMLICWHKA